MSDKTLLEQQLIATIKADGPITIEQYMATCLGDPEHGYYMSKDPFGRGGDFITSPEVSQMFGEAIGVWFATAWMMMGSPKQVNLIELGPGRGTLMADMLRATKVVQEFADAITVHMVDISPALRKQQGETLKGFPLDIHWHQRLEQVPAGPCLIAANEFFDALPIKQYIRTENGWFERMVEVDENDQLVLGISLDPVPAAKIPQWAKDAEPGDIAEVSPQRFAMAEQIGTRLAKNHGAALIVDYGHALSFIGDTFQAVSKHKFVDVLYKPGQSDLTSHVDFQALAEGFTAGGATVHDLRTQRAFLIAMGLRERLAMLRKNAGARDRIMLSKQADRLIGEKLMGNLFKVLAVTSKELGTPHPFGKPAND